MAKKIFILTEDERGLVDITDLNPVEYENFIEAMLKLSIAYMKAIRADKEES